MSKQEGFSCRIGYILAAAGSAVGLGNIWRFPYLTAKYGGGIFLLTYLVLTLTFGYSLLIAENHIGRTTRKGAVGAFRELCGNHTALSPIIRCGGWLNAIVPLIIAPYYCVIGGWLTKYVFAMLVTPISQFAQTAMVPAADGEQTASARFFSEFIADPVESTVFFLIFILIQVVVISFGVRKGIEPFNKFLMPALVLLMVGICLHHAFLPASANGFRYYLMPDISKFNFMTVVAAMGQLFFSLSIAMGIMITYGSYMRKEDNLVSGVNHVELFDTAIAFLAGLMIIPALVSFGGENAAETAGVGLVFITMPQVFANYPFGQFIAVAFFLLTLFAAATSAVSFLETNVQTISQELNLSRTKAIVLNVLEILVLGIFTILGYSVLKDVHPLAFIEKYRDMDILDSLDFLSNNILMPVAAIFTTLLVVAVMGLKNIIRELGANGRWKRAWIFCICMKFIVIPCLVVILLNTLGIF